MNATREPFCRHRLTGALGPALISGLLIACRPVTSETATEPPPAAAGPSATQAEPSPQSAAPAVAGDVLVKFRDTSESGRLVAPVVSGKSRLDAVAPLTSDLSEDVGSPLRAVRVTSGRELLLTIDRERLAQMLTQRAAGASSVRSIAPADTSSGVSSQQQQLEFVVNPKPGSDVDKLVAELSGDLQPYTRARVEKDGRVLLSIDMATLTRQAVEELQKRSDVEYAQANIILRPYIGNSN